jgi:hypothetical protein
MQSLRKRESRVVARLVQLIIPGYPDLDSAARDAVEHDVTAFVSGQIRSMPSFLQWPYRLALLGFNWLAMVRHRQPFVRLGDDRAGAYLALWSDRGLGVTRDFIKLVRSCALLAYFDHRHVRACLERRTQPASVARAIGNGLD